MARSHRKPYVVQSYGNKSKYWFKRQANKAVRRYKGNIPSGKAYRKWYPSWDICDYIWYEDGKMDWANWHSILRGWSTYEKEVFEEKELRKKWSRK